MRNRIIRGFSLIELIVALSLAALLFSLGFIYMGGGLATADSHALALVVAAQLRQARQSAVASGEPVAVIFPAHAGGAALAVAQSMYVATGISMAHVSQTYNLQGNHPGAEIFVGTWPVSGSANFTIYPTLSDQRYAAYNVTQWLTDPNIVPNPMPSDYAVVFQPDGSVLTNGLPFLRNNGGDATSAYYLITSAGCTAASTASPPNESLVAPPLNGVSFTSLLSYFRLTAVSKPWAVAITPSGEVTVSSGLPLAASGVEMFASAIPVAPQHGAPLPVTILPPYSSSTITCMPSVGATGLWLNPTVTNVVTPGVNASVGPDKRFTMAVNVSDTTGRDLYVQWTCAPNATNGCYPAAGNFSFSAPERMTFDPTLQVWTSSWDWRCPVNARSGDGFNFSCNFGDGSIMGSYPAVPGVALQTPPLGTIWMALGSLTSGAGIYRANIDGSGLTRVVNTTQTDFSVSGDGAFIVVPGPGYTIPIADLYSGVSGAHLRTIMLPAAASNLDPNGWNQFSISPRGDRLAWQYYAQDFSKMSLMEGPLDGPYTELFSAPGPLYGIFNIAWSPKQDAIAFWADTGSENFPTGGPNLGLPGLQIVQKVGGVWQTPIGVPYTASGGGWGGTSAFSGTNNGPQGCWNAQGMEIEHMNGAMCFGPDGQSLYFSYCNAVTGNDCIYKYDMGSSPPYIWASTALEGYAGNAGFGISPDGKYIILGTLGSPITGLPDPSQPTRIVNANVPEIVGNNVPLQFDNFVAQMGGCQRLQVSR